SVSRYLGLLASTMGEWQRARRHFEEALAMNARMGMRHELARTQLDYAQLLLVSGDGAEAPKARSLLNQALDTAHRLHLKPLVERGLALKLRAQGVGPSAGKTSIDAITAAMQRSPREVHSHAAPDGTVTLMFSDMEGFTEMTERLGDLEAHKVVRAHNAVVRDEVRRHGGGGAEPPGDGLPLAFAQPGRALLCGARPLVRGRHPAGPRRLQRLPPRAADPRAHRPPPRRGHPRRREVLRQDGHPRRTDRVPGAWSGDHRVVAAPGCRRRHPGHPLRREPRGGTQGVLRYAPAAPGRVARRERLAVSESRWLPAPSYASHSPWAMSMSTRGSSPVGPRRPASTWTPARRTRSCRPRSPDGSARPPYPATSPSRLPTARRGV